MDVFENKIGTVTFLGERKKESQKESKKEALKPSPVCPGKQNHPTEQRESPAQKTLTWHLQTGCEHAVISFL